MINRLEDLLDIPRLQSAMDSLYASSKIPSAIIDNEGVVHTGSGWQDVCTKFHRVHPEARKHCIESDLYISRHIHEANPSVTYKCPHGLMDSATPIFVEGEHLGNVFTGQLFLEPPDLDYFRAQAKEFGFDEGKYIEAVMRVPVITQQSLQENLAFLAHLTGMLAEMGLKRSREEEAEKKLRESEERYRAVVDGTTDAVYVKDLKGRYRLINTAALRFTGKSSSEVIGNDDTVLFPADEAKVVMDGDRGVLASGKTLTYEEHVTSAEGMKLTFQSTKGPVFDDCGNVNGLFGIARDITRQKLAEETHRESEAKYRGLFEHMQEGCAYCKMIFVNGDPVDFIYLSVNTAFVALTGLKDVAGKRVSEVLPGIRSSDPALFEAYGRVACTGKSEKFEIFVAALQQWFLVSVYSPEQGHFVAIFDVITGKKLAEETARRETALRNILLDNMPCIALVLKKRTREIVACNEIARSYGAAVGKICHDVLADPATQCPFCLAPEVWDTGETKQTEVEYMGKFWHGVWVPFSDDLYVHYIFEITARKRAEIEKEKLEAQLLQAQKMEAVGRLAGGVAHDFNNLLTVITGYCELLLQKIGKESPLHGGLSEIRRAGERAASLTQQLLAFSRKQIIEPKVLHLGILVAEINKMLTRLIGEDITLQATTGKSLGSVKVDPGQFQQILMNLVVNARDAMPEGGKIVIETANVDLDVGYCARHPYVKPGRFVMLAVSDTGKGMSEEVKAHIFEPFFTTKEIGSGTGLGLAMAYGAVHQAGGSIEVYSEVGIGTTFKIYLPRIDEETGKPGKDDRPTDLPGGTETVLLVEDETSVRDLCVQILERLGYKVLRGSNGTEAIAVAQGYGARIDLLLTDVVMPGMNGADLATQLVLHHPEMKVLFMSGYTDDAITRHGILDEGVSFIGKPYTPRALARKVREVLDTPG